MESHDQLKLEERKGMWDLQVDCQRLPYYCNAGTDWEATELSMLTGTCTGSLGLRLRFADREWQTDGRRMGRSVAAV